MDEEIQFGSNRDDEKEDNIGTNDVCTFVLQYLNLHEAVSAREVCRRWWYEVFDLILSEPTTSSVSVPVTHFGWEENPRRASWYTPQLLDLSNAIKLGTVAKEPLPGRLQVPWLLPAFAGMFESLGLATQKFVVTPRKNYAETEYDLLTESEKSKTQRPLNDDNSEFHVEGCSPAFPVALPTAIANRFSVRFRDVYHNNASTVNSSTASLTPTQSATLRAVLMAHNYVLYSHIATEDLVNRSTKVPLSSALQESSTIVRARQKLSMFRSPDFSKRLKYHAIGSAAEGLLMGTKGRSGGSRDCFALQLTRTRQTGVGVGGGEAAQGSLEEEGEGGDVHSAALVLCLRDGWPAEVKPTPMIVRSKEENEPDEEAMLSEGTDTQYDLGLF